MGSISSYVGKLLDVDTVDPTEGILWDSELILVTDDDESQEAPPPEADIILVTRGHAEQGR